MINRALLAAAIATAGLGLSAPAVAQGYDGPFADGLEFRNVGPHRGGRVTAVAGVVQDSQVYYMGATGGGVFKTTNAGLSWENISDGHFNTGSVGHIAVAPSDPNVVVVGMGESPFRGVASSQGDGVYISTDSGASWRHAGLEDTAQISRIVIDPRDPDRFFVAAQGDIWAGSDDRGVYLTEDGGESFRKVLAGENDTTGAVDLRMDPNNPRVLYAAMWDHQRLPWLIRSGGPGSGVWKSVDGGETWEELTADLPGEMGKIGVSPSAAQPGLVFAVIEAADGQGGLYRSEDSGASWTQINSSRAVQQRSWYYMEVFADPNDAETVWVLSAPLLRSTDGGRSFTSIPNPHGDQHDLWINPEDSDVMVLGNDGGGTVSFDFGRSWSSQMNQPTGQFYRVNTDVREPYWIYGGQQDNSTIAIASRGYDGAIGREDYQSIGGCESGFVDFSDQPGFRYVYAGCYLGQINEFDLETNTARDIGVYEELAFGVSPSERRHRFNWNAPIVVSDHDPETVYHAGEAVFMSRDRGYSWTAISPDLTRNDPDKQGPMGAPITNEVSENYNTISYLAESPASGDILFAGTDDGLVHRTLDGGESWEDITPRGLDESLINAIEISPHDANRIYVVATRYRFGDRSPRIYASDDQGDSWRRIDRDLPEEESWFVRVVREDPVVPGLLYAGAEHGMYYSRDGGRNWESLQLNLPRTPITDIEAREDAIVLSTQGRGFWVMDTPSVIREWAGEEAAGEMMVFTPNVSRRHETGGRATSGDAPNPPSQAEIRYWLAEEVDLAETTMTLEILDADGETVRTIESGPENAALTGRAGLNTARWNHRTDPARSVPGLWAIAGGEGGVSGYRVGPGTYTARLSLGEDGPSQEVALEIRWDERVVADASGIAEQQDHVSRAHAMIDELHGSIIALDAASAQAAARKAILEEQEGDEALIEAATALVEAVDEWRDGVGEFEREGFQDVLNWEDQLSTDLQLLYGSLDGATTGLTQGMRERMIELEGEFEAAMTARDAVVSDQLAAYNAAFEAAGAPGAALPEWVPGEE
jgi:photosystem II stability/assembly factor-like uncharacterized protein